ncbi:MAG TPA: cytoplasmic protein [Solibacterales bacterium]|nr:cytoplasmic protein [Bryobacterales bacterium]
MAKKKFASSPREKRVPASEAFTRPLTPRERRGLVRLAAKPDAQIDYDSIPPATSLPEELFVGRFYRPLKQQVSLRIDADVLAWFRARGRRYQTYMNEVLRREMRSSSPQR